MRRQLAGGIFAGMTKGKFVPPRFLPPSTDRTALLVVAALMVVLFLYGITPVVMPARERER